MGKSLLILLLFCPSLFLHSQIDTTNATLRQTLESARELFFQGRYAESNEYFEIALKIVDKKKDKAELSVIYRGMGGNYSWLGNISKGLENCYMALRASEKLGDKIAMAKAYQDIGAIFCDHHDDSLALKNYLLASSLNLETGNVFGHAQNNNAIGEIYLVRGKYSEAIKIFNESLTVFAKAGAPTWGIPYCLEDIGLGNEYLGDSALASGNKKAAKSFYEDGLHNYFTALAKFRELGMAEGIAEQHFYLGKLYIKLNRISEAKKSLQTGLDYFFGLKNKEFIGLTYDQISKIDSLEGNYERAYRNFKLSNIYKDSVYNSEEYRKVNLYKTEYEIEKKEEEIKLLASENKLKTIVAEKQKQQKLFAYAATLLLVLLGGYGFYRYRIRKKAEAEQAKLKDRLHISQGLHDDIGSTLSSISVYTQVAQKLNEKNNKEELDEMLGKINVTSFEMISEMNDIVWTIHPKNDSMEKIILRMESYAKPMLMTRNIDFKLEYDPTVLYTHLEMEKRKNFYLVFKEAVNNAFKYSGCSEITTRILNPNGWMEIQIKDNGVGFNVQQEMTGDKLTLSGNGLRNMRMRAEEMKGNLQINSMTGEGTEIRLSIPIP